MKRLSITAPILLLLFSAFFPGCNNKNYDTNVQSETKKQTISIGVFIPGIMSGSPIYEMLGKGVMAAAEKRNSETGAKNVEVTIIEAGYNQAEWENKLTSMAASLSYDLIVSSNPSLPDIVAGISAKFSSQYFMLLDAEMSGNSHVYALRYNQREQAYMAGYIAALETTANGGVKRIGLVAAQEYPVMNNIILPAYLEGARAVDPLYTVDFRIVGNWFDAAKAAELAADMIHNGVRVILCIAGGANEGTVNTASQQNAKVIWFDTNGYDIKPGTVIGSSVLRQDLAAYNQTLMFLAGTLPFGKTEVMGVNDGYVDFVEDDPLYTAAVSGEIRNKQAEMIAKIRSGELLLP